MASKLYQIRLTDREMAAVLAGLGLLQRYREQADVGILTGGGTLDALDNEEIDALCRRLSV